MDQGERIERPRNPREGASVLSVIFFCFTAPILRKGKKQDLEEKDIYKVLPKLESETLGDELETAWEAALKTKAAKSRGSNENGVKDPGDHPTKEPLLSTPQTSEVSIFWCLMKKFSCYYFLGLGIVQLVMRILGSILQPLILSKFVGYFELTNTSITKQQCYGYALSLIAINFILFVYNHNYQQVLMEYSIKVRTSLCSLIYRKALKLSADATSCFSMGKVVTLITKDVYFIDSALLFFNDIWIGIIQIVVVTIMIYNRIGLSVFVGMGFLIMMIPIQSYCGRKFSLKRLVSSKMTEERIQLVKEVLTAIKIIKMYTWERFFEKVINALRLKETETLKVIYYLKATILTLGGLTMKVAFFLLFITYTLVGEMMTAETVYFVQHSFNVLRSCILVSIPLGISSIADLCAGMKRIHQFLNAPEYNALTTSKTPVIDPKVYLNNVSVTIQGEEIIKSVSLDHSEGLLIVSGNIGSGKSSLLKTILNEYPISSGQMIVRGSISYAPEEPWLWPSTIKQNILFGQPYDQQRYHEVLRVCALTQDLNQFKNVDSTVVGDKGINLSKGQQARICLARAVYKQSDIYLLDDCLSALDGHVNKHVFKECINGFLKDKIVILINNNMHNIKLVPTGQVLFLENGTTLNLDEQKESLDKRITYYIDEETASTYLESEEETESDEETKNDENGPLIKQKVSEPKANLHHEENKRGSVLWKNYVAYYKYTGGIAVLLLTIVMFVVCQGALSFSEKLLSTWVKIEPVVANLSKSNQTNSPEYITKVHDRDRVLKLYSAMVLIGALFTFIRSFSNFYFCTKAGRQLHKAMVSGVLNASMVFFDNHRIGNIVNRVSKDFHTIDEAIPYTIYENFRSFFMLLAVAALIISVNYYFLIPLTFLVSAMFFIHRYYIPTGRSLKRLDAAVRSPMIGYINASLEGLPVVHACKEERILQHEFDRHQDLFTSAFYMSATAMRTFAFALEMACFLFNASIILIITIFSENVDAGDVGLAVIQATGLMGTLQWAMKQAADMENYMTAVERVLEYADAESEVEDGKTEKALPWWPKTGSICFDNVCLTYQTTGEKVMKNVSFKIEGKSKIGIVGRTGAGKTSIISSLFRLYDYEGTITIDAIDIKSLPLEYLRSNIGIIPQDPILFTGTVRSNIDPLNQYSDAEIWSALDKVQMKKTITDLGQPIDDNGRSYSSGQRQLLCLARALICKNKIVVLDEATANMDVETDALVQKTMQDHFADCTVLTIAHRLDSFQVADKILVVEDGKVVQFDKPSALLADSHGQFHKMVRDSGGLNFI